VSVALLIAAAPAGAVISGNYGLQRRAAPTINETAPLQYHGGPVLHASDSYAIYWDPTGAYRGDWKRLIDGYFQAVGADSGTLHDVFALNGQYRDSAGQAANQSTFRGAYTDQDPYPVSPAENCTEAAAIACLTDKQIRVELQHVIASGSLPGATGPPVYYVLTPPGVTVCTEGGPSGSCSNPTAGEPANGICGYHAAINPESATPIVYAVQPWVAGDSGEFITSESPILTTTLPTPDVLACQDNRSLEEPNQLAGLNPFGNWAEGLADVIVNDLSVEQNNIVVDPLLNGWYQSSTQAEQGDMCQWVLGPPPAKMPVVPEEDLPANAEILSNQTIDGHSYYLQWAFDSVGLTAGKGRSCWSGVALEAHFTAPNPVNPGDVVGFDATESDVTLDAHTQGLPADEPFVAPQYSWNFGDGTEGSGPAVFHSYPAGGTYKVELTVTDSSANRSTHVEYITVGSGGSGPGTQRGSGSPSPGPSSSPSPGGPPKSVVKPVAVDEVLRGQSLMTLLHDGLAVHYSVGEPVAGRVELLLASSVAHKLGLHGASAVGLAPGSVPQTVIGKAIVVTTKGGHSTVRIKLDKRNAKILTRDAALPARRRLAKLSLMLRLVVRNVSAGSTTVSSLLTLRR
jgi:hypothetical protein